MKKLTLPSLIAMSLLNSGCSSRPRLLLLNWGEYINEDLVVAFEKEYNCDVIISLAESNEMFYQKVKSGTTVYDLIVPSDYMAEKMFKNNLLQPIDYTKLTNYDGVDDSIFMEGVRNIKNQIFPEFNDYAIPYFWGTFGLMYNRRVAGLEESVKSNSLQSLFDVSKRPQGTRTGMYNVPRFAYAMALLYAIELQQKGLNYLNQELSPNVFNDLNYNTANQILINAKIKEWGTDTLKHNINSNNLDLAFVYTGDFFDILYARLEENPDYLNNPSIGFHLPDNTISFLDAFVISKKARHVDLAHKFIDFFLRPEVSFENASIVGYSTPLEASYQQIINGEDRLWATVVSTYPYASNSGIPLVDFDQKTQSKLITMINNIKST